jgi:hypothetical protein
LGQQLLLLLEGELASPGQLLLLGWSQFGKVPQVGPRLKQVIGMKLT